MLHALLMLSQHPRRGRPTKTMSDLINMWQGVDYLFVDEVSMIGCKLLHDVSEALQVAKENDKPFGGVNIIFAGDFSQLPPVGQTRLYAKMNTRVTGILQQANMVGKLLWYSVDTVVLLHEVMRQSGSENDAFVALLGRLWIGKCTTEDYEALLQRTVSTVKPDWNEPGWKDAPIIVYENAIKDAINEEMAMSFARETGRPLHWYYSVDRHRGARVSDSNLQNRLWALNSGQTQHRLGRIPLVIGMPLMISQNYDVDGGVVNGTSGTLEKIRYWTDEAGLRHAVSCIVRVDDMSSAALPGLRPGQAVAIHDDVDLSFVDPYTGRKCLIKRTQIPVCPAFAMTAHKSQGRTLTRAIVDFESCTGTEAPYVMASRVKSLEGLLVVRWFPEKKIQVRPSEDLRLEITRLRVQCEQTRLVYGTDEEKLTAQAFLNSMGDAGPDPRDSAMVGVECSDGDELDVSGKRLHTLQKQADCWHAAVGGTASRCNSAVSKGKRKGGVSQDTRPPKKRRAKKV